MENFIVPVKLNGLNINTYIKSAQLSSFDRFYQGFITKNMSELGGYYHGEGFNTNPTVIDSITFSELSRFFSSIKCGTPAIYLKTLLTHFDDFIQVIDYITNNFKPSFFRLGFANGFIGMSLMGLVGLQYSQHCKKVMDYVRSIVHGNRRINLSVNNYLIMLGIDKMFGRFDCDYSTIFAGKANSLYIQSLLGNNVTPEEYIRKIKNVILLDSSYEFSLLMFIDLILGGLTGVSYDFGKVFSKDVMDRVQVFSGAYTYAINIFSHSGDKLLRLYLYGVRDNNNNYWITTNIPAEFFMNVNMGDVDSEYFFLPLRNREGSPLIVSSSLDFSVLDISEWGKLVGRNFLNRDNETYYSPHYTAIDMIHKSLFMNKFLFNKVNVDFVGKRDFFNSVLKSVIKGIL